MQTMIILRFLGASDLLLRVCTAARADITRSLMYRSEHDRHICAIIYDPTFKSSIMPTKHPLKT